MTEQNPAPATAWRKENTLTAPSDRDPSQPFRVDTTTPPLTNAQLSEAMKELNVSTFVEKFPAVERKYSDPVLELQRIGLVSFVPAKGAKPNEHGIYGFAKLRGNFATEVEANERAEYLIRNVDSYQQIYHTFVGRPFPLTISSDYSKEVNRVDLQAQTAASIKEDVRQKRQKEQQEIEEIKTRERELLEDVEKVKEDADDRYTTLRVKKAQLVWTYAETEKKMQQMCGLIAKARKEIEDMDKENPELKTTYFNKYMEARRKANLSTDRESLDDSFVKYLVEDIKIQALEDEYNRLYGEN